MKKPGEKGVCRAEDSHMDRSEDDLGGWCATGLSNKKPAEAGSNIAPY